MNRVMISKRAVSVILVLTFALSSKLPAQVARGMLASQSAEELSATQSMNAKISIEVAGKSIKQTLDKIAAQAKVRIFYRDDDSELSRNVSVRLREVSVLQAVKAVLDGSGLEAAPTSDGTGIMVRAKAISHANTQDTSARNAISGIVVDSASGQGIKGASITLLELDRTTLTDQDGRFQITGLPNREHSVNVKALGYISQTQKLTLTSEKSGSLRFVMRYSATSLSEVVTTATGQQRRVEVSNDIVKIDGDKIRERAPVRNIADMLEAAQVPGVLVQRGGGELGTPSRIRMRGIGSISQSNDPVYIVDGVWIDGSVSKPSRVDMLDPETIETIEIVRGPSAGTLYGQDAANGVIVITTKKGQVGATRWSLNYSRDWGQTYGRIPLAYRGYGSQMIAGIPVPCSIVKVLEFYCIQDSVGIFDPNHRLIKRTGTEEKNALSLALDGGSRAVRYAITVSANNTIGVRRTAPVDHIRMNILGYHPQNKYNHPSALDVRNITSNFTLEPRNNLTIGLNVSGNQSNLKDNKYDIENRALAFNYGGIPDYSIDTITFNNQSTEIKAIQSPVRSANITLASQFTWNPRTRWIVSGGAGVDRSQGESSYILARTWCQFLSACKDSTGERREERKTRTDYSLRVRSSTTLNFGKLAKYLEFMPSLGGDFRKSDDASLAITIDSVPPGERSMFGRYKSSNYSRFSNATAGWYADARIGIMRKLYFNVGIRQDIGSAITSSGSSAYPKLGTSWLVSDEEFWVPNKYVGLLRLRGAMGYSAVQPFVNDIYGRYTSGYEYIDGVFIRTAVLDRPGNVNLVPEKAVEFELGIDADLLYEKVNITLTYAHKENKNNIVERILPPSIGGVYEPRRKENIARVRNKNLELSANVRAIETNVMRVELNYNLTMSDNAVVRLGDGILPFGASGSRIEEGYPIAGKWARQVLGYRDINGDGLLALSEVTLSDSSVYVGWSQPRYRASYGIGMALLGGQLRLDSRLSYQSQYAHSYARDNYYGVEDINAPIDQQALGILGSIPAGTKTVSDVRWNSASISYSVPHNISRAFKTRQLTISLRGSNLGLWTNYIGRDPGVNSAIMFGDEVHDDGVTIPSPRLFSLNFKWGL